MTAVTDTASVLVLDAGYQPHRIVTWYKALSLLISERAEIIAEYDDEIQTVSVTMKVPAVIRLLKAIPHKKRAIRFSRVNVMARDKFSCQFCGQKLTLRTFTYDHVLPRSRFKEAIAKGLFPKGTSPTCWENIVASCYPCNNKKGNRTPEEAGLKLRCKPTKPEWLPIHTFHLEMSASIPESWASWIHWNHEISGD